jgi:hypothetical protein
MASPFTLTALTAEGTAGSQDIDDNNKVAQ